MTSLTTAVVEHGVARSLVDTNILVYAQDRKEPIKRPRAVELIDRLSAGGEFVL